MSSTSASGPRQRIQMRSTCTRPRRVRDDRQGDPRLLPGRELAADDLGGLDLAALLGDQLEAATLRRYRGRRRGWR